MKIRAYLALMAVAILIPVMLFSAISLNMLLRAEREAALRGVRETARTLVVSIDRELTNAQSAVRMLATSQYLDHGDFANFYKEARYADKAGATWTALLDDQGRQLLNTFAPFGAPMPTIGTPERVASVLEAGVPQISNLIRGAVSHALLVVVDVPVTTADGKRFVIAQGFKVEHFNSVLEHVSLQPGWMVGAYDRNGITIARTGGAVDGEPRTDLREAIRSKTVGVIRNVGEGEHRLYTVLDRSALSGWTVAVGVPEAQIESAARRALMVSMIGLVAAIACAMVAAIYMARHLTGSIASAAQLAHALERDEPVVPSARTGVAEVDEVKAAIVAAAEVVSSEKRSRQLAEQEREKLFASEHAARTMAERQNRAKDEFLAMLGHELRNPLSAIVNAINVIGFRDMPPTSTERARQIIDRQSQHLSRIVDDLLDVGRVHSGKILLERCQVRLDQLVNNYIATLHETGRASQHVLSVRVEPAWVYADTTRMEQIISNLLDNALKYTPKGGSIAVGVQLDGGEVVLTVSDNGVGIAPELMPYVFDLFVQGKRALDRPQGGLGVGLALAQRLAQMHEGRINVRSEGTGKGSTFELRLPELRDPDLAARSGPRALSTAQTVLLIEDNEDGRETMKMMLSTHHYGIQTAADGMEGLQLALQNQPDVALIDIGLPGIDGYEVARRLRADARTANIRLIALTGYGLEADHQRAIDAGFDMHLVKPVELDRLIQALEMGPLQDAPA
jgi:signal transduction histidine kinase/ActR/RegA family two-component response regulator